MVPFFAVQRFVLLCNAACSTAIFLFVVALPVASAQYLSQPAALLAEDDTDEFDPGDDFSATIDESEEEGFDTEPVGEPPADKPPADVPSADKPPAKKPPAANPCTTAYKSVFYDNDFSYLRDPEYSGHCFGDCWKLMPVGNCGEYGTLDVGGQARLRYHHEVGMGQDVSGPGVRRFEDTEHDIMLSRVRLYSNWKANDCTRVYVEGIFADVTDDDGTYLPRPIDRNFGDFLNAFVDYSPQEGTTLRVGRQELLYGAERLISPLDWANTRRTFEGVKLMLAEGDWKVDGFYTHYVPVIPNELDHADYEQPFYGVYSTYAGWENKTLDLFYIGYDNNHDDAPIVSDFSLDTIGSRLFGTHGDWLYEMEGGYQFGRQSGLGLDQDAGYGTAGIGRKYPKHSWTPTLWFYYDYASGNVPGGDFNRFNQLYPLAHKYFGFIDAVQRSNIESPNVLLTMKPTKKWDFLMWYWYFMANSGTDVVPSIGGTPIESLSRTHFGDELDLLAKYAISPRSSVLFGYSHFWRGDKILAPKDADFFYTQWEMNF
jgi:hypothetical protein